MDQKDLILEDYVSAILGELMDEYCPPKAHADDWNIKGLKDAVFTRFGVDILAEGVKPETLNRQELGDAIFDKLKERYDAKEKLIGPDAMRHHERMIMLSVIDQQWKDHLLDMDHLKEGIGLRGYGQHDPLVEYKRESFDMFEAMMQRFQEDTVRYLYLMQIIERPATGTNGAAGRGSNGQGSRGFPRTWQMEWPRPPKMVSTSADEMEEAFMRRKRRELEQARMAGGGEMPMFSKSCAVKKSVATILVIADQVKNIRSVTARRLVMRLMGRAPIFVFPAKAPCRISAEGGIWLSWSNLRVIVERL